VTPEPGYEDSDLLMISLLRGYETVFFNKTMFRNNDWIGNPVAKVSSRFQALFFLHHVLYLTA
jgi:hypothetical protein